MSRWARLGSDSVRNWLRRAGALVGMQRPTRDTDNDWSLIGETDPYFGVLTHDRFKRGALNDAAIEEFFSSGRDDIRYRLDRMRALSGAFEPRSALDFGCGVGRLTRTLAELTGEAVGVDVSPGMLAEARAWQDGRAKFVDSIPDRQFDWVVSIIVLQHIPPTRGYAIVGRLLGAVAPGGGVTLQITYARREQHARGVGGRLVIGESEVRPVQNARPDANVREGTMIMYDYDLSQIIALFNLHAMGDIHLEHTDHGGLVGVTLYARKAG